MADTPLSSPEERTLPIPLLLLGFGLYWSSFCYGPLGSNFTASFAPYWADVLSIQASQLLGTAAGCTLACLASVRGLLDLRSPATAAVLHLAAVACVGSAALSCAPTPNVPLSAMLFFLAGAAMGPSLCFWCECFYQVYRWMGRGKCVALVAIAQVAPTVVTLLVSYPFSQMPWLKVAGLPAGLALACVCQVLLTMRFPLPARERRAAGTLGETRRAPLSRHNVALLLCLGFVWGIGSCLSLNDLNAGSGPTQTSELPLILAFAALAVCALTFFLGKRNARFGGLVRVIVTVVGILLAFVPLIHGNTPVFYRALSCVVFILVEVALLFFLIEASHERGVGPCDIIPGNYGLFVAGACCGAMGSMLLIEIVGGQTAWELVGVSSTVAVMLLVPFLPSRASGAATFTYDSLPENDTAEVRAARRRDALVERYGLNERETAVLDLILKGMTRGQMAEELHLSSWTIKDRVSSIYEKTGAHSYNELIGMVSGD